MPNSRQIVCPQCMAINRITDNRPAQAAKCGKCGSALFAGKPVEADAAMFERQTGRSEVPVLVDVWAPWCGPCRMMAPEFETAAGMLEPGMRLIKLNSDNEPAVAGRLGIRAFPPCCSIGAAPNSPAFRGL